MRTHFYYITDLLWLAYLHGIAIPTHNCELLWKLSLFFISMGCCQWAQSKLPLDRPVQSEQRKMCAELVNMTAEHAQLRESSCYEN